VASLNSTATAFLISVCKKSSVTSKEASSQGWWPGPGLHTVVAGQRAAAAEATVTERRLVNSK
jgi:hypothetical protein